jgi:hypothetical protein
MTLGELCYAVRRTPLDLERWARLGALGDRLKEPRDRGKWRHITKETAGRVIIMERLLQQGIKEAQAAPLAASYVRKDHWPNDKLTMRVKGVVTTVYLEELELP